MGLIHWIEAIIILLAVVVVAGIILLSVLFPGALSLIFNSVSAYFSSASSNSTFSSPSINFSYPANWVSLNGQLLSSSVTKLLPMFGNYSVNGTIGSIGIIFPASFVVSLVNFIPQFISNVRGNLSGVQLPSSLSIVVGGGTKISNGTINLYKVLSDLSSKAVINNVSLSGVPGFIISLDNETIAGIHVSFSRFAISQVNGSVCFVFGVTNDNNNVESLNYSFDRVKESINCSFSSVGAGLPSGLLSHILPNITK